MPSSMRNSAQNQCCCAERISGRSHTVWHGSHLGEDCYLQGYESSNAQATCMYFVSGALDLLVQTNTHEVHDA